MPVRSLRSSVLVWPDARTVERALHRWAASVGQTRSDVVRIGYFGSYARGDWGVGSDLDLVIIVDDTAQPPARRSAAWQTHELPVPVDVLVYTIREWQSLDRQGRFWQTLMRETIWVYVRRHATRDLDHSQVTAEIVKL